MGFHRRKRPNVNRSSDKRFGLAVNAGIDKRIQRLAAYLNRRTQYWNRSSKVIALFIFCLVFGSACLLLLMQAMGSFK
jgi:hypothetical protein